MTTIELIAVAWNAGSCRSAIDWLRQRTDHTIDEIIANLRPDWAMWALRHLPTSLTAIHRKTLIDRVKQCPVSALELLKYHGNSGPLDQLERAIMIAAVCHSPKSAHDLIRYQGDAAPLAEHELESLVVAGYLTA